MSDTTSSTSGGGFFSKLIVVLLLAVAVGLYLRIVMVDSGTTSAQPAPQASVQVVEGSPADSATASGTEQASASTDVQPLPDDQMKLIKQVFAPELLNN